MIRIICIGNRFAYPDNFGILIYEKLKKLKLNNIEVVEGGVGGLNLMPYFEDDAKILIVDWGEGKKIQTNEDIKKLNINEFNHSNAFLYLLKSIDKEYTIYVCSERFDDVDKYIDEILTIAKGL
jgi:Ni,Fe-hydrogenase maturation factor